MFDMMKRKSVFSYQLNAVVNKILNIIYGLFIGPSWGSSSEISKAAPLEAFGNGTAISPKLQRYSVN